MSELNRSIPVIATERLVSFVSASTERRRIVVTGAAGVLGTVAARGLRDEFELVGIDVVPETEPGLFADWHLLSIEDRSEVFQVVDGAHLVIHAATGAASGWPGLRSVEMEGTRNVLDAAAVTGVLRVVIASTNHVVGWTELDYVKGIESPPVGFADPLRPDGLYAASKVFVESIARAASEYSGLRVSVLRIGTMRFNDDPMSLVDDPSFSYLGGFDDVANRMSRTWLFHDDFVRILKEEFAASDDYRVRFATSNPESYLWSREIFCWSRP